MAPRGTGGGGGAHMVWGAWGCRCGAGTLRPRRVTATIDTVARKVGEAGWLSTRAQAIFCVSAAAGGEGERETAVVNEASKRPRRSPPRWT